MVQIVPFVQITTYHKNKPSQQSRSMISVALGNPAELWHSWTREKAIHEPNSAKWAPCTSPVLHESWYLYKSNDISVSLFFSEVHPDVIAVPVSVKDSIQKLTTNYWTNVLKNTTASEGWSIVKLSLPLQGQIFAVKNQVTHSPLQKISGKFPTRQFFQSFWKRERNNRVLTAKVA